MSRTSPPSPHPSPRSPRPPLSLVRRLCVGAAVLLVGLGVGLAVLSAPLLGLASFVLTGVVAGWAWARGGHRWPARVGPGWAAVPVAGTTLLGWLMTGGPGAALVVCLLGATVWVVHGRAQPAPVRGCPVSAPPLPAAVPGPRERGAARVPDVRVLTDAELCRVWRRDHPPAGEGWTVPELTALVASRRAVLDELERRHPAGFAAWIDSGARVAGDPSPYLRSRQA